MLSLTSGCGERPIDEVDAIYYKSGDVRVFCAANLDRSAAYDDASLLRGLDRAAARGEVINLFAHVPGESVAVSRIEKILAHAEELGLEFVVYRELGPERAPRGGLALSFDDDGVDAWNEIRPLLARHGARVTFFVTRMKRFTPAQKEILHALEDDGHEIEAHGLRHLSAPDYVEEQGLSAYIREEFLPSLELLRDEGFDPKVFAYPYGEHTSELDDALLQHVDKLRGVSYASRGWAGDRCPR